MEGYASDSRNPYGRVSQEIAHEQRLQREAQETCLGTLGDKDAPNVAKVEVSYGWYEPGLGFETTYTEHAGHFVVHAGEEVDIYETFNELVEQAMEAKAKREGFQDWQIDDIYSF